MKQVDFDNETKEWTYQEDVFLAQRAQSIDEIKWHKIAKKINKVFHNKQEIRKSSQVKRRYENVIKPLQQKIWTRSEALKFCELSSQYVHSSRRFWNRLKKEFGGYSYKMLMHKLKQLKELNQAQFVFMHKNQENQRQKVSNDPLSLLCLSLGSFE